MVDVRVEDPIDLEEMVLNTVLGARVADIDEALHELLVWVVGEARPVLLQAGGLEEEDAVYVRYTPPVAQDGA